MTIQIAFGYPRRGLEGSFNTFRLGASLANRIAPGDIVELIDSRSKKVLKLATVVEIDTGVLTDMAALHASEAHNWKEYPAEQRPSLLIASMKKRYPPNRVFDHSVVTVVYLKESCQPSSPIPTSAAPVEKPQTFMSRTTNPLKRRTASSAVHRKPKKPRTEMRAYKTFIAEPDGKHSNLSYHATRSGAHDAAKVIPLEPQYRSYVRVVEVEIGTDKQSMIAMLNQEPNEKQIKEWSLTSRGGLKELDVEGA